MADSDEIYIFACRLESSESNSWNSFQKLDIQDSAHFYKLSREKPLEKKRGDFAIKAYKIPELSARFLQNMTFA